MKIVIESFEGKVFCQGTFYFRSGHKGERNKY